MTLKHMSQNATTLDIFQSTSNQQVVETFGHAMPLAGRMPGMAKPGVGAHQRLMGGWLWARNS